MTDADLEILKRSIVDIVYGLEITLILKRRRANLLTNKPRDP